MNYTHLSIEERCCLRKYYNEGISLRKIAELLGRNVSTISRELRRNRTYMNCKPAYFPHTAQKKSNLRKSYCHRGIFWEEAVLEYISEKLRATWSPEEISLTPCEMRMPSFKTIYRWIYQGYLVNGNTKLLRRKGKSKSGKETRGKLINKGKSIRKRDKSVYRRNEFGHWEIDTVVSGAGKSKACFVTMAERKTRYYIAVKVENRTAEAVKNVVIKTLKSFPQGTIKTITTDNGKEFAKWQEIENELKVDMYFADPYCAWQKGTNENLNGLLREFYPKGRNLARVSAKTLALNVAKINNRPKKVLNFHTPAELFEQELQKVLHLT